MQRTLEPELMDDPDQCQAYADADFQTPNAAFVARLRATFPDLRQGRWLDLGCGPADIAIRLCADLPEIHVVALDASGPMLDLAQHAIDAAGLTARITPRLDRIPLDTPASFDAVLSNSLLHHIPAPLDFWRTIASQGRPGAAVLVVDLARPADDATARALVDQYAADEPNVLRHDFYHSLHAAFTPAEVRDQLAAIGLDQHLHVAAISDRHLAVHGHLPAP